MRVRILKQLTSQQFGLMLRGDVVDIPDKVARNWCRAGLAMQDKSLDGPKETKSQGLYWCDDCGCSHKSDSEIGKKHRKVTADVS